MYVAVATFVSIISKSVIPNVFKASLKRQGAACMTPQQTTRLRFHTSEQESGRERAGAREIPHPSGEREGNKKPQLARADGRSC